MKSIIALITLVAGLHFSGCQSYVNTPAVASAREAKRAAFSDPLLARAYHAQPTMRFPATIAVASNSQDTRDHLRAISAYGTLDKWSSLPQLARIVMVSPVLTEDCRSNDACRRLRNLRA